MKVLLIRHAQSEENVVELNRRMTIDAFNAALLRSPVAPLTEIGRHQAQVLIERLASERIDRLYSSPFERALTTASIIGAALSLEPQVVDDLREVMPYPLRQSLRSFSWRRLWVRSYLRMLWPWYNGETWAAAYRRACSAWSYLTSQGAETIAVVSHRALISLILLSLRRNARWRVLARDLSNGGVSIVVSKDFR